MQCGFSFIPTDRAPPGSTFKWIDNKKCIFTVEIEAVSSVHTESEHLGEQASSLVIGQSPACLVVDLWICGFAILHFAQPGSDRLHRKGIFM